MLEAHAHEPRGNAGLVSGCQSAKARIRALHDGGCCPHRDAWHAIGRARRASADETEIVPGRGAVVVVAAAAGQADALAVVGRALVVLPNSMLPLTLHARRRRVLEHFAMACTNVVAALDRHLGWQ